MRTELYKLKNDLTQTHFTTRKDSATSNRRSTYNLCFCGGKYSLDFKQIYRKNNMVKKDIYLNIR